MTKMLASRNCTCTFFYTFPIVDKCRSQIRFAYSWKR